MLNILHTSGIMQTPVHKISQIHLSILVKIFEFHDHIWNHHYKCIQMSTNMPTIGQVFHEIRLWKLTNSTEKKLFCIWQTHSRMISLNWSNTTTAVIYIAHPWITGSERTQGGWAANSKSKSVSSVFFNDDIVLCVNVNLLVTNLPWGFFIRMERCVGTVCTSLGLQKI